MSAPLRQISPGQRFGLMTFLHEAPRHRTPGGAISRMLAVRCDCGTQRVVRLGSLVSGHTMSCGCYLRTEQAVERRRNAALMHGQHRSKLYVTWQAMKERCGNPRHDSWPLYGGRGIKVCSEWVDSFAAFAADVGPRPDGTSLDRINNDGDYEPGNCRWATFSQQARNTRRSAIVELRGERMPLIDAAERLGVKYKALETSLRKGTPMAKRLGVCRVRPCDPPGRRALEIVTGAQQ